LDNEFVITKHKTIFRKIKFTDCVYDLAAKETHRGFRPEEMKFHVQSSRNLPERVEADVAAARVFFQDVFAFRGVEAAQRMADFDFETMPLGKSTCSPSKRPSPEILESSSCTT
jgi:hypothetical protein